MRLVKLAGLLLMALLLLDCTAGPAGFSAPAGKPAGEGRRILVTFQDRQIERGLPVNPMDRYRPRGSYEGSSWGSRIAGQLAEKYALRPVLEWPITALGVHCVVYEVPPGRSVAQAVQTLAQDRRVDLVQPMQTFRLLGQPDTRTTAHNDPYYRLQAGFQAMHIEQAQRWATGRGVRIALIDTGVDRRHPDLMGQIATTEDFVARHTAPLDDDVHGTAIAGVIVARADNGEGIVGTAPDAKLYVLRACWPEHPDADEGVCNSLSLALALNEAIRLKPQVLNLSLTGPPDPLLERLIGRAIQDNIIVVAADPSPLGPPSSFPAILENVIAVRNGTGPGPRGADARSVSAPGTDILTTVPHSAYDFLSGSSFSAAHVTGVIALMLELHPGLSGAEMRRILQSTQTQPSPDPHASLLVDGCMALAALRGPSGCSPSTLAFSGHDTAIRTLPHGSSHHE